ncbi:MAG: hypothetical protein ACI379_14860 [Nocardioides sp.]|uniref:hypothetical protein n=1 Tax=Nocardioides sp. TaxID=35761 RepID=UPI003EFEFE2F
MTTQPAITTRFTRRLAIAALVLAVFSAAMWFAWLGWDHEYYLVDGVEQGPYRPWQVIGCAAAIALAGLAAQLWSRSVWGVVVLSAAAVIGFAVPWSLDAAATDDSGLYVIGLFMIVIGGGIALTALLGVATGIVALVQAGRQPAVPRA